MFIINILNCHAQFNNLLSDELPTKKYHEKLSRIHDLDLFALNVRADINSDTNPMLFIQNIFPILIGRKHTHNSP